MGQATEDAMVNYMRAMEVWVNSVQKTHQALLNHINAVEKRVSELEARLAEIDNMNASYSAVKPVAPVSPVR